MVNIRRTWRKRSTLLWWLMYCNSLVYFLPVILRISKVAIKRWWTINGEPPLTITETRITKHVPLSSKLNLNNCSFECTPTETSAGGTLLCIANHLSYKCHNDLDIYVKKRIGIYFYWNCQPEEIKYYSRSHLQTSIYGPCWL